MPYYLQDGQKTLGPFSVEDLVQRPEFTTSSLIFPVGASDSDAWKPASDYPEVAAGIVAMPAPRSSEITLMLPPSSPRATEAVAPAPAFTVIESAPTEETFVRNRRPPEDFLVLIVDDDETVRSLLEVIVTSAGYRVATASDGKSAAAQLDAVHPNLVITDLMMPGVGGYEFLRSLQTGDSKRLPIFVVTASDLDRSTIAMIRQEANVMEFIAKPINSKKLLLALEKTLRPVV